MVQGTRICRKYGSPKLRPAPYAMISSNQNIADDLSAKKSSGALDKKDWIDATCSVCMEFPHNVVLLLCSSFEKACRPYMCATSCRYSNCLEQYINAYAREIHDTSEMPSDSPDLLMERTGIIELACPLCRGQVKGWAAVEPARRYLNAKQRSCMQDSCTFVGTYKELRKHVRAEHPWSRPRDVDPADEQRWRRFVRQQEMNDVISYVRSMPHGATFFGDYVIEGNPYSSDREETESDADRLYPGGNFASRLMNFVLFLHNFEQGDHERLERISQLIAALFGPSDISELRNGHDNNDTNAEDGNSPSQHGREITGGRGRSRRRRTANANQDG